MELAEIKEDAKNMLQGKRFNCAMVAATPLIIEFIYSLIFQNLINDKGVLSIIVQVISIVISIFLALGCLSYFLKISRNEEVEYREVFSKGSLFIKILIVLICILFASNFPVFLWYIIGGLYIAFHPGLLLAFSYPMYVYFAGVLLLSILGIIRALSYSMVEFIILDNPEIGIIESMTTSKEMMKGHKWEYFLLGINIVVVPVIILIVVLIFLSILSKEMVLTGTLLFAIVLIAFLIYIYTNIIPQLYLAISIFYNNLIEKSKNNNVEESIENN